MLYQEQKGGYISNVYNAEIINKTNTNKTVAINAEDPAIKIRYIQAPGVIKKGEETKAVFFVLIPGKNIQAPKTDVKLQLMSEGNVIQTISTSFVGPMNDQ